MLELESVEAFDAHLEDHNSLTGVACQGLDLTGRGWRLMQADVRGAFFLGCVIEASALDYVQAQGACVFPPLDHLPFRPFRADLYTAEELYWGYRPGEPASYDTTPDAEAYRFHCASRADFDVVATLVERIHDHAIDDALRQLLAEVDTTNVVAIMGGHGLTRSDAGYRDVAVLGRELARAGFCVATGGGPGAMEAANLGAWLAPHPDAELGAALEVLAQAATFEPVGEWLDAGFAVRDRWPRPVGPASLVPGAVSLGVPTWHYGHEPPNVFATHIAKYFANSIREDGLLAIALGGVVFTPGSAGTIQEVFQDAAQNHYESFGGPSPMVFFGQRYWSETKPVYPLLFELAAGRSYQDLVVAHDEVDATVEFLARHRVGGLG